MTAKEIVKDFINPEEETLEEETPLEISTVMSIFNTLGIDFDSVSEEQFLGCCETVYSLMLDMVEIGQFTDLDEDLEEDDEPDLEEAEKPEEE